MCVCVRACVRMGLCNELETWVRLKWLVISPGRWEPGAAWIKRLPGWLTKHHLLHPQTETRVGRAMDGEESWTVGWQERWVRAQGRRRRWGHRKRACRHAGQARDERDAGYVLSKEEREIETGLLAFMKKYREIEVTRWWGWKGGGERKGLKHH